MIQKQTDLNLSYYAEFQMQPTNQNQPPQRRRPQRKTSQIFQRVTEEANQIRQSQHSKKRKEGQSKTKVDRRDTRQTDLAVSQISAKVQQLVEDAKMSQMLQKAQNDPFLRRKLKNMMQNDLKSLKRLNSKNPVIESHPNNNNIGWTSLAKKSLNQNTTQILQNEYKNIPKDISMVLNNTVIHKRNVSLNNSGVSKLPTKTRLLGEYTEEQSVILINNQATLKQEYTTLRKQNYKTKVLRLQILRQLNEKQKAITTFAIERFGDRKNIQNISKLSKIGIPLRQ